MSQHSQMASLWDALGRPQGAVCLPAARDPGWQRMRSGLCRALREVGCLWTPRSPAALARAVTGHSTGQGGRPLTWQQLCASDITVLQLGSRLRAAREGDGGQDCRLTTWNARWLVDPAAQHTTTKRAIIQGLGMEGRIALIQETHWDSAAAALWAGLFPGCRVLASPARPGPHGGPQGGGAWPFSSRPTGSA